MSYLTFGFHTGPSGYGVPRSFYEALDAAGIPYFAKGSDSLPFDAQQIAQNSSIKHHVVYRRSVKANDGTLPPSGNPDVPDYNKSPVQAAKEHWEWHKAHLPPDLDPAVTWLETINEVDKDRAAWLADFAYETAQLTLADGYKWLAFGWSTGEPEPEHWRSPQMERFLRLCAEYPDRLGIALHEYSLDVADIWNQTDGSGIHWLVGRFEHLMAACDYFGIARPTVMFTEWGWTLWDAPAPDVAMQHIKAVGSLYSQYPNIKGAAIWCLNGGWQDIHKKVIQFVEPLKQLTLNTEFPDPEPEPEPTPDCYGLPREDYRRVVNVLPPEATLEQAVEVFKQRWQSSRETVTGSYDDAGIGDLSDKTAVLWGIPLERHAEFLAWYQEHYPGTKVEFENLPGGVVPGPQIDVSPISQRNPLWANVVMGDGKTIGNWGCLLTAYNIFANHLNLCLETPDKHLARMQQAGAMSGPYLFPAAMRTAFPNDVAYFGYKQRSDDLNANIKAHIDKGYPVPARVDFNPATGQWEQHWVLITGYADDDFYCADPWYGDVILLSSRYNIAGNDILEGLFYERKESSDTYTGPAVDFVAAVDNPASDWRWPQAKAVFDVTGLAVKFHTQGNNHTWFNAYKNPTFNLVRILLDPNFNGDIYQETVSNMAMFYNLGARDFEVLNEPNLEGMGVRWNSGAEFGAAFKDLCARYKAMFPGIRLWFPGCSPQFGGQYTFIDQAVSVGAFDYIFGMCEHVYSGIADNQQAAVDQMVNEVMEFRKRYALTRPLAVSEFSVNRPASASYKAAVYKAFYERLGQVAGIQAAVSFTSDWGDNDPNQEGWLKWGIHTAFVA